MISMTIAVEEQLAAPLAPVSVERTPLLPTGRRRGDRPVRPISPFIVQLTDARFRQAGRNPATLYMRRALLAHYAERDK